MFRIVIHSITVQLVPAVVSEDVSTLLREKDMKLTATRSATPFPAFIVRLVLVVLAAAAVVMVVLEDV